jgi:hypothetical protein
VGSATAEDVPLPTTDGDPFAPCDVSANSSRGREKKEEKRTSIYITNGKWVIFVNSWKAKGAVKFVLGKNYFWLWLLAFEKAKVG